MEVVLSDKSGLVEDLSLDLTWGLFDITGGDDSAGAAADVNDQSDLFLSADLSYAMAVGDDDMGDDDMMMKGPTLTPGTKVTINQLDGEDATVGLEVRALLEHAMPQTTFGLKWATGKLLDVGDVEADIGRGLISISSPLARALIGKEEGETATVVAPDGEIEYEILSVEYL